MPRRRPSLAARRDLSCSRSVTSRRIAVSTLRPLSACCEMRALAALRANGEEFPIDRESAGRKAFSGKTKFENPDFAGLTTPEEMTEAVHVAAAMEAGMTLVHVVQMHNCLERQGG